MSKKGIIYALLFIVFSIIGRTLFPFGDEPDFSYRVDSLINKDHYMWSPYSLTSEIIKKIDTNSNCKIYSGAFAIWSHIDSESCTQSIEQILLRVLLTLFVISPILLIIICKQSTYSILSKLHPSISKNEWNSRIETMTYTLIFPSVIYYTGILGEEQFTLILSFLVFIFWRIWWLIFLILTMIGLIDFGNSIIVILFTITTLSMTQVNKHVKFRPILAVAIIFITLTFIFGSSILGYIADLSNLSPLSSKALAMTELIEEGNYRNNYPTILRPIITYMTSIFMLPSGVKILPLYIFYFLLIVIFSIKITKKYKFIKKQTTHKKEHLQTLKNSLVFPVSAILVILTFVFIAPNYSFGKYYIFMIPFIIHSYILNFGSRHIGKLFIFSTLFTFSNLILFQI
jgi:MFS family permease